MITNYLTKDIDIIKKVKMLIKVCSKEIQVRIKEVNHFKFLKIKIIASIKRNYRIILILLVMIIQESI